MKIMLLEKIFFFTFSLFLPITSKKKRTLFSFFLLGNLKWETLVGLVT